MQWKLDDSESKVIRILANRRPVRYITDPSNADWLQSIEFEKSTKDDETLTDHEVSKIGQLEVRRATLSIESIGFEQSDIGLTLSSNKKSINNQEGRVGTGYPVSLKKHSFLNLFIFSCNEIIFFNRSSHSLSIRILLEHIAIEYPPSL